MKSKMKSKEQDTIPRDLGRRRRPQADGLGAGRRLSQDLWWTAWGMTRLTVHRLAARTLIHSLEMEEREHRGEQDGGVKKKVVELSVQSGVSSAFTAFIAVKKGNGEAIQGPLVRRIVPTPRMIVYGCRRHYKAMPAVRAAAQMRLPLKTSQFDSDASENIIMEPTPQKSRRDPLLQLVSLQKASDCWVLDPDLAAALGKTSEEVEISKPTLVNQEVWATTLALIWLHGFKMDAQEEWELLAMKAVKWLRAQNACVTECVDAGNALLGCSVQKDALGL